jgi:hypothetical protein
VTRLSVAVRPPRAIVDRIAALPRAPHPGLNWSVPEQWIVKLRPLGHVPEHLVAPLGDALAAALDGAPAPECALGPATVRPGGQWLYAPVAGLDELNQGLYVYDVRECMDGLLRNCARVVTESQFEACEPWPNIKNVLHSTERPTLVLKRQHPDVTIFSTLA